MGKRPDAHERERQEGDKLHGQFPRHAFDALGPVVIGHVLVECGGDGLDQREGGVLQYLLHVLLRDDSSASDQNAGKVALVRVLQAFE